MMEERTKKSIMEKVLEGAPRVLDPSNPFALKRPNYFKQESPFGTERACEKLPEYTRHFPNKCNVASFPQPQSSVCPYLSSLSPPGRSEGNQTDGQDDCGKTVVKGKRGISEREKGRCKGAETGEM
ncbi:hypothetical protein XENOCAPTIV_012694 [Xenoophorus captivus]|uniref:Uncharacterized protein n=1 Tax=Xenoophorus captivus TaxID=1517983 RepID=A0ABV0Q5Q9_9TELE